MIEPVPEAFMALIDATTQEGTVEVDAVDIAPCGETDVLRSWGFMPSSKPVTPALLTTTSATGAMPPAGTNVLLRERRGLKTASNIGGRCSPYCLIDVRYDDASTFVVKAPRDGEADTPRSAGDNARLVLKSLHSFLETVARSVDCFSDQFRPF